MHGIAQLRMKIMEGSVEVAVVGLGSVGLPLCEALIEGGLQVTGIEIDQARVDSLNSGGTYLAQFSPQRAQSLVGSTRFKATNSVKAIREADVVIICVPTPLSPDKSPNLATVLQVATECGRNARGGQLFILESTSYPGTTEGVFAPAILSAVPEAQRAAGGEEFLFAYSPEREDPGRTTHTTRTTPKLVGGTTPLATELAAAVYEYAVEVVVKLTNARTAEASKMLENTFRSVNIALANEMKQCLAGMGVDIWEAIEAASTKPFGYMPFEPGPGVGGHCISVDPYYFAWRASETGSPATLIELANSINAQAPGYVAKCTQQALQEAGIDPAAATLLLIGLAYKPNVNDIRDSPAISLVKRFHDIGAAVEYHDPFIPITCIDGLSGTDSMSTPLTEESLARFDAVVIATNHDAVDYALIGEHARIILDTRNAMKKAGVKPVGKLILA